MLIRYSRWDGSQAVPDLDADDLLSAMSDDLMLDGDPWRALRRLFQQGLQHPAGRRTPGLKALRNHLRQQRQQRLDRYALGGALEDIKKKLAEVIQTEREGIKDRLAGTSAEQKLAELDKLPPDPGGQIRELQTYDFVDPEAKRRFDELMQSLRAQMLAKRRFASDRKSTRLNSSHSQISYAGFCLKKQRAHIHARDTETEAAS